jgi:hypothetical protein
MLSNLRKGERVRRRRRLHVEQVHEERMRDVVETSAPALDGGRRPS